MDNDYFCIPMADTKMRIGIIGAGNVGVHLTRLFMKNGVDVFLCSAQKAIRFLPDFPPQNFVADLKDFPSDLDLILFTRRDRDLDDVLVSLPVHYTLVHCSGSLGLQKFSAFKHCGVFYPLQTFRKELSLENANFPVFIEASDDETLKLLENLASVLTLKAYPADEELRARLHLSGVLASNFVNHLYTAAYEQIPEGLNPKDILLPLMKETLSRLDHGLPAEFQTGPALRKDEATINLHLEMLKNDPQMQDLYKLLSEIIKKRHS